MAKLNLDSILNAWDLTLRIGGVDYATRALNVGDLAIFEAADAGTLSMDSITKFVQSLFVEPVPDVATWEPLTVMSVLSAVGVYTVTMAAKKKQAVISAARQLAEEPPKMSGTSAPSGS